MNYQVLEGEKIVDNSNGAGTYYSDWLNVTDFNELYGWIDVTAFANQVDETLDFMIERETPSGIADSEVVAFTQKTAVGEEEKTVTAGTGLIGGKVRFKITAGGSWGASVSATIKYYIDVKRV